jgi:hypothetical protein
MFNEVIVYWLMLLKWPDLHRTSDKNAQRLLLVADPQLIGDNDEPWYYKTFSKWDSDRYLHNTFILAQSFVRPNATIFLGDLFDEGLKATDQQYDEYYNRFKKIFDFNSNNGSTIYIPGDNDIGGENFNERNSMLNQRFIKYFLNKSNNKEATKKSADGLLNLHKLNHLGFLTLDLDYTYNLAMDKFKMKVIRDLLAKQDQQQANQFLILLNHMSIVKRDDSEIKKVCFCV